MQRRTLQLYVRRGLLSEQDAKDMLTWRGTGGFSLDGSVRIAAHDRAGLERLLRYGLDRPRAASPSSACGHSTDRGPRGRWAQQHARVYEVHPLRCPACHGAMRILAFLTDPGVPRPILRHLRIPEHPPPVSPARGPPQTERIAGDAHRTGPTPLLAPHERIPPRSLHPGPTPVEFPSPSRVRTQQFDVADRRTEHLVCRA